MAFEVKELGFVKDIERMITQIISNKEKLEIAIRMYGSREYGAALEDADFLAERGYTKAQFTALAGFSNAMVKFMKGTVLAAEEVKDYNAILDIVRIDYEKETR